MLLLLIVSGTIRHYNHLLHTVQKLNIQDLQSRGGWSKEILATGLIKSFWI